MRGGKMIALKKILDEALPLVAETGGENAPKVHTCVVLKRLGTEECAATHSMTQGRDWWWDELLRGQSREAPTVWLDAEAPCFVLYTSGSTGTPKGILHTTVRRAEEVEEGIEEPYKCCVCLLGILCRHGAIIALFFLIHSLNATTPLFFYFLLACLPVALNHHDRSIIVRAAIYWAQPRPTSTRSTRFLVTCSFVPPTAGGLPATLTWLTAPSSMGRRR